MRRNIVRAGLRVGDGRRVNLLGFQTHLPHMTELLVLRDQPFSVTEALARIFHQIQADRYSAKALVLVE